MTHYSDSRLKDKGSHFFLDWQTGGNVWSNRFKSVFSRTRKRGKADQTLCLVHWIFWDQFWQDTALTSCEIVRYLTLWFVGILSEENNNTKEGRSKIPDIQLFSCFKNTKRQTVACCHQPSLMKGVLFHLLLLFVQIYLASKLASSSSIGKRSNADHLIKTKSGKYFLQWSSKKPKTKTKKDTKKIGNNDSNNRKVTGKKGTNVKVTGKRGVNKQLPFGQ